MNAIKKKKSHIIILSLYIACLLSNISQLPAIVTGGYTQLISFPGWILVFISILFTRKITFRKSMLTIIQLSLFLLIWLLFDSIIIQESLFSSSMIYSYFISLFVFFLGGWAANYTDEFVIDRIIYLFIISMLIVTLSVFIRYFGIGFNLATRIYAYGSKNSVSQIIFTAIILLIIRYQPASFFGKCIKVFAIMFEIYVVLLLRSRATLVSLILAILVILFSKNSRKRVKIAIGFVGVTVIFLLLTNSDFNNFIFNNVLFAGRNASNLNELTSGRVDILGSFPYLMSGNWFTGIGPTYFECFPLSAILQFGLLGGITVILISLQPLIVSFFHRKQSKDWNLLFIISLGYSVNGLFEGLTPFGPGVKCYFMWLMFGILLNGSGA